MSFWKNAVVQFIALHCKSQSLPRDAVSGEPRGEEGDECKKSLSLDFLVKLDEDPVMPCLT